MKRRVLGVDQQGLSSSPSICNDQSRHSGHIGSTSRTRSPIGSYLATSGVDSSKQTQPLGHVQTHTDRLSLSHSSLVSSFPAHDSFSKFLISIQSALEPAALCKISSDRHGFRGNTTEFHIILFDLGEAYRQTRTNPLISSPPSRTGMKKVHISF